MTNNRKVSRTTLRYFAKEAYRLMVMCGTNNATFKTVDGVKLDIEYEHEHHCMAIRYADTHNRFARVDVAKSWI